MLKLYAALSLLIILFTLLKISHQMPSDCTFSVADLPIPENRVIKEDPRKSEDCQKTSFDENKPNNLFNPDGLRMWSREENSMSISTDHEIRNKIDEGLLKDPFFVWKNVRVVNKYSKFKSFNYLEILKTGSTSLRYQFLIKKQSYTYPQIFPSVQLLEMRMTSVRHPISRLLSGIGTILTRSQYKECLLKQPNNPSFIVPKLCSQADILHETLTKEDKSTTNETLEKVFLCCQ